MEHPLCVHCGTRHPLDRCPELGTDDPMLYPVPELDHEEKIEVEESQQETLKASQPRKRGRPKEAERASSLTATAPWRENAMSRATWYRRQHETDEPKDPRRPGSANGQARGA